MEERYGIKIFILGIPGLGKTRDAKSVRIDAH
jgi:hypothetical protein